VVFHFVIYLSSVPTNDVEAPGESRYITTDQTVQGLGLNILGGNATGIFVCDVKSPGYDLGIRVGDQLLEVGLLAAKFS
jgi:hypothetical protein